jgi:Lectin C-type domain
MVLMLTLVACSDKKAQELSFQVSFACDSDRDLADELTLRVLRGGCDGDEALYEETLAKGEDAPSAEGVGPGDYGLEASAFSEGALLASGCVETTLPKPGDIEEPEVVLRSESCDAPIDMDGGDVVGEDAERGPEGDSGEPARDATIAADGGARTCSSDCSDSFPCTEDRCVNGECVHEPFTGARECDDIACTQGDHCETGTCQAGTPNNAACPDDGNPCTAETCEPETGCNRDNAEGATCNDQIGCTNQDACKGGICRGTDSCASSGVCSAATGMCTACTGATDCDDLDPCTTDSCAAGACKHVNNTGSCNDGKSCTANDLCNNRVCAGTSTCPSDATCGGSTCRCNDTSKALCSNTCVTLATSNTNCGQCGRVCASGGSCQNSACKPSAASNCTAYRYGGHDYLLCPDSLNWSAARERCRGYGFGLAIVDNQAENDFLRTRPNAAERWFGANDRGKNGENCRRDEEEGIWYWASPSDTSADNFKLFCAFADRNATTCTVMNNGYQNWRPSEPNNDGCNSCAIGDCSDGEDCGVFNADGTWNDAECDTTRGFICETP